MSKNKRKKILLILFVIILILLIITVVILNINKDTMIINMGIRSYNRIASFVPLIEVIVLIVVAFVFLLETFREIRQAKRDLEEQTRSEQAQQAARQAQESDREVLSVSRKMDSMKIRDLLLSEAAGKWNTLTPELMQIKKQLDQMDEHQDTLAKLLKENGASSLANTEEMLNDTEQYLCKNVRKALNYMSVADEESPQDVQLVRQKLLQCRQEGDTLLEQVQKFLFSLAEFLNTQGSDDNSMEMLDLYRSTILSSIEENRQAKD